MNILNFEVVLFWVFYIIELGGSYEIMLAQLENISGWVAYFEGNKSYHQKPDPGAVPCF